MAKHIPKTCQPTRGKNRVITFQSTVAFKPDIWDVKVLLWYYVFSNKREFTSNMQKTMTEIPVVRKLFSKKSFNLTKQPCKEKSTTLRSTVTDDHASIFKSREHACTFSLYRGFTLSQRSRQQDSGTSSPQSVTFITPQQSNWNRFSDVGDSGHMKTFTWAVRDLWSTHLSLNQVPLIIHICWVRKTCFGRSQTLSEVIFHHCTNLNREQRCAGWTHGLNVFPLLVSTAGWVLTLLSYMSSRHATVSSTSIRRNSSRKNCHNTKHTMTLHTHYLCTCYKLLWMKASHNDM